MLQLFLQLVFSDTICQFLVNSQPEQTIQNDEDNATVDKDKQKTDALSL